MKDWIRRGIEEARGAPRSFLLVVVGLAALAAAIWIRAAAFGVTAYVFDPSSGVDVNAIGPKDPIPPNYVGTFTSPLRDDIALWIHGHSVDMWSRTGRPNRELPAPHVIYRGRVKIPGGNHWKLAVGGSVMDTRLYVDGEPFPAEGKYLAAGWHDIQVSHRSTEIRPMNVVATRGTRPQKVVPSSWLAPDGGTPAATWIATALGLLALAGAGLLARDDTERARGILALRAWGPVLVVALALVAGTALRAHGRLAVPKLGETWDEYQEAWQGWSLVHGRTPKAWGFPPWQQAYRGAKVEIRRFYGRDMMIVEPYLEHPPLFAVLVGISAYGAKDLYSIPLSAVRRVPLLLTLLFYPLLYAIARRSFGRWAAALAVVIFAVGPPFVLMTRFAKGDLLVALLSLVAVWAGLVYRETRDRRFLWAMGVACGLAPWSKEVGIYALVLPAIVLAPWGRRFAGESRDALLARLRPVLVATGIAAGVVLLYFVYGALIDWDRFLVFLKIQGATRIGRFDSGAWLVQHLPVNWKNQQVTIFHGAWVFLWMTVFAAARRRPLLPAIAFVYLAALVAAVDARWLYGWYQLPLHAPLAACAGAFLFSFVRSPNLVSGVALLAIALLPFGPTPDRPGIWEVADADRMRILRLVVLAAIAPLGLDLAVRTTWSRTLARVSAGALVAAFVAASVVASWTLDRWYFHGTLGS